MRFKATFILVIYAWGFLGVGAQIESPSLASLADRVRLVDGLEVDTLRKVRDASTGTILSNLQLESSFESQIQLRETAPIFMWGPFSGYVDPYEDLRKDLQEQSFQYQFATSLDSGNWDGAYRLALLRYKEDPDNPHVLRTLASISAMKNDYEGAVKFFLLHHPHDPENVAFLGGLGHALFNLARFEASEIVLDRVFELSPDFLPARFTLAALQVATNAPSASRLHWETATMGEKEKMSSWLHADRSGLVRVLGDKGYVELCDVLIGAGSHENMILIPNCLKHARQAFVQRAWNQAAVYYDLAFGFGVQGVAIMQQRARAYLALKREVEALKIMYDLTLRYPQQAVVWFNLGYILMQTEARSAALEAFDHAVALDPENGSFLFARACALGVNDRLDEAWALLEGLAQTHPDKMDEWLEGEAYYLKVFHQDLRFPALLDSYNHGSVATEKKTASPSAPEPESEIPETP